MSNLLMISGDRSLAEGKHGAFYNTLEELHKHFEKIDVICPKIRNSKLGIRNFFDNVEVHPSLWPLIFQPFWILRAGLRVLSSYQLSFTNSQFPDNKETNVKWQINGKWSMKNDNWVMTVHDYPPFYNGIGAFLLWCRIRIPYLLEIHHIPGYPKSANFREWLYRIFAQLFIVIDAWPARAVRVVNQHQTKEFLIRAGVPASKIMYIPSIYIDHGIFKPQNEPKEYDLIFVGRLAENKGVDLLLEVAKKSNLEVLIVGDGPLKKYIDGKIKEWKLVNVKCFGWAKDSQEVASLINKSKLFVLTSLNEGGPRVVAEALACGVPVLATSVGIIPDIKDACTIIDWDVTDIVNKANHLLNDEQAYKSKVELGLEVSKQFNKESAIKNYAEKIASLIS
ncbi:MAG: glycosyltransferase [bacterium]|nr:glycosyltransferase [bacterium]